MHSPYTLLIFPFAFPPYLFSLLIPLTHFLLLILFLRIFLTHSLYAFLLYAFPSTHSLSHLLY
ncbi:hypothetical protein E2C01_091999 [Portunus trituberculatus]|uniref:Uncharacterized protein n=1 Tax=Portunus trituberculatus TaxID=210409 RepID=A0A5B7JQK3_PORTR|nr:hypothetical protein [Portunus trituberculatus]